MYVCPNCGERQFTVRQTQVVDVTVEFEDYTSGPLEVEVGTEVLGVENDCDNIQCTDCFAGWEVRDLITEEAYNEQEDECR